MAYKFNIFTKKLDYYSHAGILSYTFLGVTEVADPVDPGIGNFVLNDDGVDYQLVISTTDKNGRDLGFVLMIHSKRDPTLYYGLWMMIEDIDTIEDEDENVLAWILPMYPFFASTTYDPESDEYTWFDIPVNDEVVLSMDFAFNPDYIGSMGTQDSDDVSITGGTISTPVDIYRAEGVPVVDPGWASSSTINMNAPDGYGSFTTEDGTPVVVPYWIRAGV
jgi:hypothetical protein